MPKSRLSAAQLSRPPMERMLAIHGELKRGAFTNCTKLAAQLEVSTKTVMRDIGFMRDRLGLPIDYDRQLHAFRYSYPVENFPTVQMSGGEMLALVVAQKALEQYRGTPYHAQLTAAFDKLAAGVRDKVSFSPTQSAEQISFHRTGLAQSDLHTFEVLSRAVAESREVTFAYRKPRDTAAESRHVQPYHLANRDDQWHLLAFDVQRGALRQFALSRIVEVEVRQKKFERPADFSAERYFEKSFGAFPGTGDYAIVIRFVGEAARRVAERNWHESQEIVELSDGGIELHLRLGSLEEVAGWVLGWGPAAEVLRPASLRALLADSVQKIAAIYASARQ
jgi:predicted DNA-binding transcriptional regulator YafY